MEPSSKFQVVFHEFGHALVGLLSRTKRYHHAGTRGPLDYSEFPSTFLEYFCWDIRFLSLFLRHKDTNKMITDDVIETYRRKRMIYRGLHTQKRVIKESNFTQKSFH